MDLYNADFHLHGPRSIGVSKNMDLPHIVEGSRQKGLQILGTGDCLQPDWLKHLRENLERKDGAYLYKDVAFILQTEVEDNESVHQVVLLPDFAAVDEIRKRFKSYSSNLDHEWGGRPRLDLSPAEVVEIVTGVGGLVGPAHAFTPFRSLFRQGKFDSLEEAYGGRARDVHFLELGLSANTDYADRISELHRLTFMSNSDAHAPTPHSLGREFNTLEIDSPTFDEVDLAIRRKDGRRFTRNVGMDPRLGKYNVMFCQACRRRLLVKIDRAASDIPLLNPPRVTGELIVMKVKSREGYNDLIRNVDAGLVQCPGCAANKKKAKIKLGVSERVRLLADTRKGVHPDHRPPYMNAVPLTEILRVAMGIKSKSSKVLEKIYDALVNKWGSEITILLETDLGELENDPIQEKFTRYPGMVQKVAKIIESFRENKITFMPGGGGKFGELVFEA